MRIANRSIVYGVRRGAGLTNNIWRIISIICLVLVAGIASPAQGQQTSGGSERFEVLVNFNENSPAGGQNGGLVQGMDGNLYGTTAFGGVNNPAYCGSNGCGTVYKMTPSGAATTIYNFCSLANCADGGSPDGPYTLALGTDGNFYGTTFNGGANLYGTIFRITPSGTLTTLYNVCAEQGCADGGGSFSGVVLGPDGNFYGTMVTGGAYNNSACAFFVFGTLACGAVFKITPQGAFSTIYNFCSQANCSDGGTPYPGLTVGADGNLYGIAAGGGTNGFGTIFKLSLSGTLDTLHSFDGTDGACFAFYCHAPLVQASDGNLYGVTGAGGSGRFGSGGVVFQITPAGAYRVLHNFCSFPSCPGGILPLALVYASDGDLYGAATIGGTNGAVCGGSGCGTIFKITPDSELTIPYAFDGTQGYFSQALGQDTSGVFYGTTEYGGAYNDGQVFALLAGLRPFVELLPAFGDVGNAVQILGRDLTEVTSVSFNGTPAAFTVMSKTLISATVPSDATSGFVTLTGMNGALESNVKFQVAP